MRKLERQLVAHTRILRDLGPTATFDTVREGWPVFDSLMAAVLYRDGKPVFMSSVLAEVLQHDSRIDGLEKVLLPKADLIAWGCGIFDDDITPLSYGAGRWECIWLGEVDFPVPIMPLTEREVSMLPTSLIERISFVRSIADAAFHSNTRWVLVSDDKGLLEIAFELSEMLGYDPRDHQWIPDRWRNERVEPGIACGFETVTAADGSQVVLRYYSYRIDNASVYLPRIWHHGQSELDRLQIRVPITSLS